MSRSRVRHEVQNSSGIHRQLLPDNLFSLELLCGWFRAVPLPLLPLAPMGGAGKVAEEGGLVFPSALLGA